MTADHKVLNEEGESRNNHRHAVVVQDLATQWVQSYPRKNRNFLGDRKECQSAVSHHGITELRHFIDPRRMALLKEWYAE